MKKNAFIVVIVCLLAMIAAVMGGLIVYMIYTNNIEDEPAQTVAAVVTQAPAEAQPPAGQGADAAQAQPAAAPVEQTLYVVNVNDSVYLRKYPDMSSETFATISLGSPVTLVRNENAEFTRVRYNGIEGYIRAEYLTTDSGLAASQIRDKSAREEAARLPAGSSATTVLSTMYVTGVKNSIYLRTAPSENAPVITTIPVNSSVGYIDSCVNGFYKIAWNGQMGYSKSQYLTSSQPYYNNYSYSSSGSTRVVSGVKNSIYLRSSPSSNSSNILEIPVGATVEYLGDMGNGYYKIRYNGIVGYGTAQYLR